MNYIEHVYNGQHMKINVQNRISFVDLEDITRQIADGVFDDIYGYAPYRYDYYFWFFVLHSYTDLDVENMSADELYTLIDDPAFTQKIAKAISASQLQRINNSATEMISQRLNKHPLKDAMQILSIIAAEIQRTSLNAVEGKTTEDIQELLKALYCTDGGKKIIDFLDIVNKN